MDTKRAQLLGLCLALLVPMHSAWTATFSGNASISAGDSSGALSADPVNNTLTISCWFRISIPSSTNLTENMVILMDRTDGNEGANYSYQVRLNVFTGNVEFLARGSAGAVTNILIARPYLDRWYHIAVVRQQSAFTAYVDGRQLSSSSFPSANIGTAVGNGLSIGGISGNSRLFMGDIVEVAVYQAWLDQSLIQDRMFMDQRTSDNIKGYYKLAYSTNITDCYRNFVPSPPSGTDLASKQGSGNIEFEETDQAGEQSLFDSRKNRGQDAITPLSGGFSWSQTALARPVPGIAFDFHFGYSSATPTAAPADGKSDPYDRRLLGPGWRHSFDVRLVRGESSTVLNLLTWDGAIEVWDRSPTNTSIYSIRHREYRGELVRLNDGTDDHEWTTADRLIFHFRNPDSGKKVMDGRLLEIRDFNGNKVKLLWNENEGYITNVVDTASGRYLFNYNTAQSRLTNVTFGSWQVNFAYGATNLISKSITNTSGLYAGVNTTWQFQYNATNSLLERIIDPRGNTNVFVQYDKYGRKTNSTDALGRSTATEYGVPDKRQIRHTDPEGSKWVETYDRKGHILAQQDPLTNVTRYAYDTNGNRISVTEPLGWKTSFGYDNRANVIAKTNALGEVTRWAFHGFFNKAINEVNALGWTNYYVLDDATGNLLEHYDYLNGTKSLLVTYTYRTNGLVETSTDANGKPTRFNYNTNGFLISRTDPGTNTWNYTYNDIGWKIREANPLDEVTSYTYNLNGNVVMVTDPLFRHFSKSYDPSGNLIAESDGKEILTRYAYDAANQRTNKIDRTGTNQWFYTYTARGKLATTTDPQTNRVTQVYDAANRLLSITDPQGNSITNIYDANGNLTVLIDQVGQRWSKSYDRLNRVFSEINPQGDARQTKYDQAGRIEMVTTPNGYPSTHTYDGRGRLIKWVDAENNPWLYDYDGNANITNITDALSGHYVMTYGQRNERLTELNQDLQQWGYVYDELLRLKEQTDPNGTKRTITYDAGGRVELVRFNTGRENRLYYDDNNNPRNLTRRVGTVATTTQLNYDVLDRVIEQVDAFQQTVRYGYDSLSRVTSLTYPDNKVLTQRYDSLGRLTEQVDWAGRQMSYAYDKAGRLIARTYPNGVTQSNTFDNAGRITGLAYSALNPQLSSNTPINIALTYAYDRNGNKVGGGEKGTLEWPLPALSEETSQFTAAGRITNRVDALNSTNTFTYQYDPSGNMTNANGGGQSWALAYDEDNRTTNILWQQASPATSKVINSRYDALGRRIAKTVNGDETRYVLDLQGSMERILCDTDAGGNITAWYVHGPDLCYKVDATNGLNCYHADAMANIIALTDGNTNLVAQYAYTPYGRSLVGTNSMLPAPSSQPYLFVGSQGVMEEMPGLYFMRARYYSADAGVFLSTDSVKKIGPGWKPILYAYANSSPISYTDANGQIAVLPILFFVGVYWALEQTYIAPVNKVAKQVEFGAAVYGGTVSSSDAGLHAADTALSFIPAVGDLMEPGYECITRRGCSDLGWSVLGHLPFGQTLGLAKHVGGTAGFLSLGFERDLSRLTSSSVPAQTGTTLSSPTAHTTRMAYLPSSQITPPPSLSLGGSSDGRGTSGGGGPASSKQFVSGSTPAAGVFGNLITANNGTQSAGPTGNSILTGTSPTAGTTPMFSSSFSSGGGFGAGSIATSTQRTSTHSTSSASTSSSSGGFWGWLGSLFH